MDFVSGREEHALFFSLHFSSRDALSRPERLEVPPVQPPPRGQAQGQDRGAGTGQRRKDR